MDRITTLAPEAPWLAPVRSVPPGRPALRLDLANLLLRPLAPLGLLGGPLERDALVERALIRARRDDPGDLGDVLGGLDRVITSLEEDAHLTLLGRSVAGLQLELLLARRIRADRELDDVPPTLAGVVRRPVFVVGLARSGTTYLQRLLALDPRHRALPAWLALSPHPRPSRREWATGRSLRITAADLALRAWHLLSPSWTAKHDTHVRDPEEELPLLAQTFRSPALFGALPVLGFDRWAFAQDQRPAYHLLRRYLQHLQVALPGERWVLKSAFHLAFLDDLLSVFPDACIVQTHRDPADAVPSLMDLLEQSWQVVSSEPRRPDLLRHVAWMCRESVDRGLAARARHPQACFVDVHYDQLVAEPEAVVRQIHARLGTGWPDGLEDRITRYAARSGRRPRPKPYAAEDFGYTRDLLRELLRGYVEAFDLAPARRAPAVRRERPPS